MVGLIRLGLVLVKIKKGGYVVPCMVDDVEYLFVDSRYRHTVHTACRWTCKVHSTGHRQPVQLAQDKNDRLDLSMRHL